VRAETADYLAKARATLADAQQIANLPLPHIAAREAYLAVFHAAEAYIFEHTVPPWLLCLFDHCRGDCPHDFSEKNKSDAETTTKPI
jgi:hypothetical protein